MSKIGLIGGSSATIFAYRGLMDYFDFIELFQPTAEILEIKRNQDVIVPAINSFSASIIYVVGYNTIIPVSSYTNKNFINVHPSLLPKYRGLHSTVWAILNGEKKLGYTIHLINEYLDDGDIIYQFEIDNDDKTTAQGYFHLFNSDLEKVIGHITTKYIQGVVKPKPQNKSNATWVGKRSYNDCNIDFNSELINIKRLFRVLTVPYPLPFFTKKNEVYEVVDVDFFQSKSYINHNGRILNIDNQGVWVSVIDGFVILKKIRDNKGNNVPSSRFKIGMWLND